MEGAPTLSYILPTRNKLPYLRLALEKLIDQKEGDDEICVADGASTDGTKEYLEGLQRQGKIQFYVSEPDYGLAHALNKLVLSSRGSLLKYITDDDTFDYDVIKRCKEFMLGHPEIDLVNTEGGSLNNPLRALTETDPIEIVRSLDYAKHFREWQKSHTPFSFCDMGVLFRRSSLPAVGLWDPIFPGPDVEFSLRVSSGRVNIAWYTGYGWVNISNPQSVSMAYMQRTKKLTEKLFKFYLDKDPDPLIVQKLKILRNKLRGTFYRMQPSTSFPSFSSQWPELVRASERWLAIKNGQMEPEFLWGAQGSAQAT